MSDSKILASLARVVDVVVDESHPFFRSYGDVGAIRYRLLDSSGKETDLKSLDIAYPMDRNIFSFPSHQISLSTTIELWKNKFNYRSGCLTHLKK